MTKVQINAVIGICALTTIAGALAFAGEYCGAAGVAALIAPVVMTFAKNSEP